MHEVVQRHERRIAGIGVRVPGERGRMVDTIAAVDMHRDRQPVGGSGLPDGLEHRLAVRLARLHRNTDLHQLRVIGQAFDLRDGASRVFRIDPDGAQKPVGGVGLEPAVQQPVVDCGADPAVEQVVGDVAAGQRVQDRVVHAGVVEQMAADGLGIRPRVVLSVEVLAVVAAGRLIPLLLDVGDRPQLGELRGDSAGFRRCSGNAVVRWCR